MAMFDDPRKYLRKMDEELRAERAEEDQAAFNASLDALLTEDTPENDWLREVEALLNEKPDTVSFQPSPGKTQADIRSAQLDPQDHRMVRDEAPKKKKKGVGGLLLLLLLELAAIGGIVLWWIGWLN